MSDAVAKKEKIPFITWMGKSENITGKNGHRYVFSVTENTAMAGKAAANVLSKKPYKKYWVAGDDYEYGHALDESLWRYLKQAKPDVEVIGKTWWKLGEPDLIPYFTSIQAANPDAIHFCTGGASMANVLKTIKTTGISQKIPVYIHTAIDYAVLKPLGAEAPEGVMGTMDYLFYYPELSMNQKFVKEFQARLGDAPGISGLPRLHHGPLHCRGVPPGRQDRQGEVHRRPGGAEGRFSRGQGGDARLRPPGHFSDSFRDDQDLQGIRVCRRHRHHDPAGGRGHARLRGDRGRPQRAINPFAPLPAPPVSGVGGQMIFRGG